MIELPDELKNYFRAYGAQPTFVHRPDVFDDPLGRGRLYNDLDANYWFIICASGNEIRYAPVKG